MFNNNGVYQLGNQYYPWSQQQNFTQSGTVYYNQYGQNHTQQQDYTYKHTGLQTNSPSPSRKVTGNFKTSPNPTPGATDSTYLPDPKLPPYNGPYPVSDLQKARECLIDSLTRDFSDVLQRVKPKIGIDSCYGKALEILPPELPTKQNKPASAAQGSSTDHHSEGPASSVSSLQGTQYSSASKDGVVVPSLKKSASSGSLKRKATDDILEGKAKKLQSESSSRISPNTQHVYKCDFCHFQCSASTYVEQHLIKAKHFSASLYNARDDKPVSVEKKLAIKNAQGKNEALVVVCPSCHDVFEDIFMCGVHYKYSHGGESNNGFYAVCPVIHQETLVVYQSATCQVCKVVYEKQKHLHRHWDREPTHHPLSLSKTLSTKAFAIYSCLYCNRTFHTDFLCCKSHVLGHKDHNHQARTMSALKVRHIMLPTRNDEVLPLSESAGQDGFADEIAMLKNMRQHFNGMSGTKSKISMIENRIRYLKQFRLVERDNKTDIID